MPTKKSLEELTKKYQQLLDPGECFRVEEVRHVNHKPHPFVIGPKHVVYASDHCNGRLGEEAVRAHPCAHCREDYEKHTHDTALFVHLKRDLANKEAGNALFAIKKEMSQDGIDGVCFLEDGFRIQPREASDEQEDHDEEEEQPAL